MDKKKTIQIAVVVVAFLGMGIVLYKGFFGAGSSSGLVSATESISTMTPASVLPYGTTFDYQKIDDMRKQGFQFGQVQYPVISTTTEVGKSTDDLIIPLPKTGP